MVTVNTQELLEKVKDNQPLNITELTIVMGYELNLEARSKVYNRVKSLVMDGILKSKKVGGSRVVWIKI